MNIANVKRGLCVAVLFAGLSPIACSSDTGGGGTPGAGGKATMDGTGGAPAGSVPCGTMNCLSPEGITAAPCCISPLDSKCGVISALGGGCGAAPPPVPKDCPMLPSLGPLPLTSCCTTGGECGVDETMFGMGCLNYADATAQFMMFGMRRGTGGMGGTSGADGGSMAGGFNIPMFMPPTFPAEQNCTPPKM